MNQRMRTVAGLDLPFSQDEKIQRILRSAIGPLAPNTGGTEPRNSLNWDAGYFGLDRVGIFQAADSIRQNAILQICNRNLLEEAYFVEKAGMGYMAKMVLIAETLEERMLYALFSADEARHLTQIREFLTEEPGNTSDPFFRLLAELAEGDDRSVLLFVIQVVLEGWGLSHYRSLAKDCQNPELAATLTNFLQEESKHHAAGVTLFGSLQLSVVSSQIMVEILAQFLQMVQVGPQGVVNAIDNCVGLTAGQRVQIFEELDTQMHSGTRLKLLQGLMQTSGGGSIVQALIDRGAFEPYPATICATI
jgi:rubrerythrin